MLIQHRVEKFYSQKNRIKFNDVFYYSSGISTSTTLIINRKTGLININ